MAGRSIASVAARVAPRAFLTVFLLGSAADALAERVFYVDFVGGNDAADGRSPQTAWQRAPGDPEAANVARAMALQPGDRVLFKGGVRYRGFIDVRRSGTAEQPIVFDGSGWGNRRAIIDGSLAAGVAQPCPSQAACLGSEHWRNLMYVPVPTETRWSDWLFVGDHAMQIAQWPSVTHYWDYDEVSKMATVPLAKLSQLQAGFIAVPDVPQKLMAGSPVLGQWSNINDIYPAASFQIQQDGIHFVSPSYKPYTNRDNKFAIYNAPAEVNAPGKFAISGKDGIAIFWPRLHGQRFSATNVSIGARRQGFHVRRPSHVRIRGFSFANFASPQFGDDAGGRIGVPIYSESASGIEISDNAFRSIVNMTRSAVIRTVRGSDIDIVRNSFEHLPWASAIYVSHTEGPVRIRCNKVRDIGRNGVRILSAKDVRIEGNLIEGVNNIHGAGINLYLDNRYAMVRDNVIRNASLPLTMHGTNTPFFSTSEPVDLNLADNVFISNAASSAALSSWGKNLHNVRITGNFLGSERFAMRFSRDERNIVYSNNRLVGGIAKPASTQLIDAGGNMMMQVDGNGRLAMENAAKQSPESDHCSSGSSVVQPLTSSMPRRL